MMHDKHMKNQVAPKQPQPIIGNELMLSHREKKKTARAKQLRSLMSGQKPGAV